MGGDAELVRIVQKSHRTEDRQIHSAWSLRTALIVLAAATVGVAALSELLVGAVEPVVASLGISEFFVGIILIPIIGNVAEHLVAVKVAMANKMDLGVEIAIASSLQMALFVAPVLVFISLLMGNPLAADLQPVRAAGVDRRCADRRTGLAGRRIELAGRRRAAGGIRDPVAGVLPAAALG